MTALPNPDIYLNHFPPQQAVQFETARNLGIAVLGATIWDILIYIPDDIKILRRSPIHLTTLCFVSSRLFALVFVLLAVIEFTRPLNDCYAMVHCIGAACVLTMCSTAFIFLQRVRAVYSNNRWVQLVAIVLWLASCATMSFTVFVAKSEHVPGTGYCAYTVIDDLLSATGFVFVGFDTFVLLATSYKILTSHADVDARTSLGTLIYGRALPNISRAILRGGQQYYFITICLQVPVVILIVIPSIPPIYKLMLTFPLGSLSASMASRIFRNMRKHEPDSTQSESNFATLSRLWKSTLPPTSAPMQTQGDPWPLVRAPSRAAAGSVTFGGYGDVEQSTKTCLKRRLRLCQGQ
ncbi:hypothetical protein D9756_006974 [Leucocoprinus leucothites]|uniref:Uncharacterized protein n=1 Tax=Leucocoprinus leucothites TaxID=201217 RepID=A0A8H5FZ46_9AGAR|nr:hypothetical protein D9756_006974 [Leucoagaricus leucothites]